MGSFERDGRKTVDIRQRAFEFAVRIVKFCQFLEKHTEVSKNLIRQLQAAGTSIGANLEEAQAAQSRPDFISKNAISLKEARETNYWLRLILSTATLEEKIEKGAIELRDESAELSKIIAAIIVSTKK